MGKEIRFVLVGLLIANVIALSDLAASGRHPRRRFSSRPHSATTQIQARQPFPAVIDSTYLGGPGFEISWSCAVDADGNVYIGGDVQPAIGQSAGQLPVTENAVQKSYKGGGQDGFVAKYDHTGKLLWSTYLGGSDWDGVFGVAVDGNGNVVVTGVTASSDFPITDQAVQKTVAANTDAAFVTAISADGTQILYSTFLGGTQGDSGVPLAVNIGHILPPADTYTVGVGVTVGSDGTIYVVGGTDTIDMPVSSGAAQPIIGGEEDAFIARIDPTKSGTDGLLYSTFVGGATADFAAAVAVDNDGNAFVTGETQSENFPTTVDAYQLTHMPGTAAFVTKLNPTGTSQVYSTLVSGSQGSSAAGGTNYNAPAAIVIDSLGDACIAGETNATDFPTTMGVVQPAFAGQDDGFVTEVSPDGSALVFSTYLGGSDYDGLFALKLDQNGNILVGGYSASTDLSLAEPFQPKMAGYYDGWLAKLSQDGRQLLWATYIGGKGQDSVYGLDLWKDELYATGRTESADFPATANADQSGYGGGVWDVFLTEINLAFLPELQLTSIAPSADGILVSGTAQPGAAVTIEAAPDLMTPFTSLKMLDADITGTFRYDDVDAARRSGRFYRAVEP